MKRGNHNEIEYACWKWNNYYTHCALIAPFEHIFVWNIVWKDTRPEGCWWNHWRNVVWRQFLYIFFPHFVNTVFNGYNGEGKVLNIFYQLGLIFLMFLSGYNTKINVNRSNSKIILPVFIGATILPMIGSAPFSLCFSHILLEAQTMFFPLDWFLQ